jgi:hypothetical protein
VFDRTVLGVFALGVDEDGHDLFAGVVADEGEGLQRFAVFHEAPCAFDEGEDDVQIGLG